MIIRKKVKKMERTNHPAPIIRKRVQKPISEIGRTSQKYFHLNNGLFLSINPILRNRLSIKKE
jgi:hypothetical protein